MKSNAVVHCPNEPLLHAEVTAERADPPSNLPASHAASFASLMKKKRAIARVDASCMILSVMLLIITNVCVDTVMADAVPESHQNLVKADSESEEPPSRAAGAQAEFQPLQFKRTRLKWNASCMRSSQDFLYVKLKQKNCTLRRWSRAVGPRMGACDLHTAARLPSPVPEWLPVKLRKRKEKSGFRNATIISAAVLNATSGATNNASSVAGVNASVPDDGKVEEKRTLSNADKVRLDAPGRSEEEQQQQQPQQPQQQQPANRSSSIPLIHRSTDEVFTKGVNYASAALGAKIVSSNVEGKHASALLLDEEERYWMSPCSANRSVVIELAESVLVKSITLMHNEYYSSISRAVLLQGAQIMPTDR